MVDTCVVAGKNNIAVQETTCNDSSVDFALR